MIFDEKSGKRDSGPLIQWNDIILAIVLYFKLKI